MKFAACVNFCDMLKNRKSPGSVSLCMTDGFTVLLLSVYWSAYCPWYSGCISIPPQSRMLRFVYHSFCVCWDFLKGVVWSDSDETGGWGLPWYLQHLTRLLGFFVQKVGGSAALFTRFDARIMGTPVGERYPQTLLLNWAGFVGYLPKLVKMFMGIFRSSPL